MGGINEHQEHLTHLRDEALPEGPAVVVVADEDPRPIVVDLLEQAMATSHYPEPSTRRRNAVKQIALDWPGSLSEAVEQVEAIMAAEEQLDGMVYG